MTAWVRSLAAATCLAAFTLPANAADEASVARGKYLVTIMDCAGCHTPWTPQGMPDFAKALAGANYGFELPGLGVFVPPNLTSDAETGLGGWSDAEIVAAVTEGVRPDGRILAPMMPYHSYSALTPEDAQALVDYLRTVPPVAYDAPGPFGEGESPTVPFLRMTMPQ